METTQKCIGCGIEKPLEAFHRAKKGKNGRRSKCIECWRPYYKEYWKRPERAGKTNESSARYYHNLTPEEKKELMAEIRARRQRDPTYMLGKALRRALYRRPTEDHVTLNQLLGMWRAQNGKCAVSGVTMTWARGNYTPYSISIDRIDSKKGYTLDNVRLICYAINTFKGVWTDEHVFALSAAVVANMPKPKLRLVS